MRSTYGRCVSKSSALGFCSQLGQIVAEQVVRVSTRNCLFSHCTSTKSSLSVGGGSRHMFIDGASLTCILFGWRGHSTYMQTTWRHSVNGRNHRGSLHLHADNIICHHFHQNVRRTNVVDSGQLMRIRERQHARQCHDRKQRQVIQSPLRRPRHASVSRRRRKSATNSRRCPQWAF